MITSYKQQKSDFTTTIFQRISRTKRLVYGLLFSTVLGITILTEVPGHSYPRLEPPVKQATDAEYFNEEIPASRTARPLYTDYYAWSSKNQEQQQTDTYK